MVFVSTESFSREENWPHGFTRSHRVLPLAKLSRVLLQVPRLIDYKQTALKDDAHHSSRINFERSEGLKRA